MKNSPKGRNIFHLSGDERRNPYREVDVNSVSLNNFNELTSTAIRKLRYTYSQDIISIANKFSENPNHEFETELYRRLSQSFFDLPINFTYRASEKIIEELGKGYIYDLFLGTPETGLKKLRAAHGKNYTFDHEWPRQRSARIIIDEYQKTKFDFNYFWEEWNSKYSRVNLVTSTENGNLKSYEEACGFTNPIDLYKGCEIQLQQLVSEPIIKDNTTSILLNYCV
jgi:hypothetical protein